MLLVAEARKRMVRVVWGCRCEICNTCGLTCRVAAEAVLLQPFPTLSHNLYAMLLILQREVTNFGAMYSCSAVSTELNN